MIIRIIFMKILLRLTHPISLGIILIFYSLLIGGVIILIIYIRTLAANEKFIIPGPINYLIPIVAILVRTFLLSNYNYIVKSSLNIRIVINLYEYSNRRLSIFLIIYLFITIVCVVKLIKFERGPLVGRL